MILTMVTLHLHITQIAALITLHVLQYNRICMLNCKILMTDGMNCPIFIMMWGSSIAIKDFWTYM